MNTTINLNSDNSSFFRNIIEFIKLIKNFIRNVSWIELKEIKKNYEIELFN